MEGNSNIVNMFVAWWYGQYFLRIITYFKEFLRYLADFFSVKLCLSTLFSPWKRDQLSYEGLTLKEKLNVALLNLTSRFIGALVKIFTLTFYLAATLATLVFILVFIVIYLGYPFIIVLLLYIGVKNL